MDYIINRNERAAMSATRELKVFLFSQIRRMFVSANAIYSCDIGIPRYSVVKVIFQIILKI